MTLTGIHPLAGQSSAQVAAAIAADASQFDYVESIDATGVLGSGTLSANSARLVHVRVAKELVVSTMSYYVGAAAGNVDLGIYTSDDGGVTLTRLGSTGSTAASGTNAVQTINLTAPVTLSPGTDYWLGLVCSDGSTQTVGRQSALSGLKAFGNRVGQKTSSFPLPAALDTLGAAGDAPWIAASV